ncbi:MAG: hypothetical protein IT161_10650 [Bryobacterales bacterium]|nr:hypothetical protein [Bryobacterales bacterium]
MKQLGFLKFVVIGLAVVLLVVAISLFINRGAHVRLSGAVLKTRIIQTDTNSAVLVFDVRLTNPAKVPFVVRDAAVRLTDESGNEIEGDRVAQMDLDRLLEYYKFYGPRYTPMLMPRERINPGASVDRTIAGSFQRSEKQLERRKATLLRIADVDGTFTDIAETRK